VTKVHSDRDNYDVVFKDGELKISDGKRAMVAMIDRNSAVVLAEALLKYGIKTDSVSGGTRVISR